MTPSIKKAPVLLLVLGALAVLATVLVLSLANRAAPQAALPADARERLIRADSPALGRASAGRVTQNSRSCARVMAT